MICGGSVVVTTWPEGQPGNKETKVLKAGDLIEIPTGMPHSLCCDKEDGLQVRARGSPERATSEPRASHRHPFLPGLPCRTHSPL